MADSVTYEEFVKQENKRSGKDDVTITDPALDTSIPNKFEPKKPIHPRSLPAILNRCAKSDSAGLCEILIIIIGR